MDRTKAITTKTSHIKEYFESFLYKEGDTRGTVEFLRNSAKNKLGSMIMAELEMVKVEYKPVPRLLVEILPDEISKVPHLNRTLRGTIGVRIQWTYCPEEATAKWLLCICAWIKRAVQKLFGKGE